MPEPGAGQAGAGLELDLQVLLLAGDAGGGVGGAQAFVHLVGFVLKRAPAFEQRRRAQRGLEFGGQALGAVGAEGQGRVVAAGGGRVGQADQVSDGHHGFSLAPSRRAATTLPSGQLRGRVKR